VSDTSFVSSNPSTPVRRIRSDDLSGPVEDSAGWAVYDALCDQMGHDEDASSFLARTNQGQSHLFALGEVHRQFMWNGVLGGLCNLEPAVTIEAIEAADSCGSSELAALLREAVALIGGYEPTARDAVINRVRRLASDSNWKFLDRRYESLGSDLMSAIDGQYDEIFEP
jgi:hypothetical protein